MVNNLGMEDSLTTSKKRNLFGTRIRAITIIIKMAHSLIRIATAIN